MMRADAYALSHYLTQLGHPLSPVTIRVWAHRKLITPHGPDERGRTLYDVAEVRRLAQDRYLDNALTC